MNSILIETKEKSYEVLLSAGILSQAGILCAKLFGAGKACIITDDTVEKLYASKLTSSLEAASFSTAKFVFPAGESSKSADTLISCLNYLAKERLTRTDAVFALGGGVAGDLSGLAASLYLRGIKLVQLPTTVLAAVDSSVGGKTAIDLAAGKNLAGTFYQPDLVLCDSETFQTLPEREFANGCAEIIKYAAIRDASLYSLLPAFPKEHLQEVLIRCITIKRDIVGADERDHGERQLLNFGHTFGHAIEQCSSYTIPHGSAVAIGMAMMTRASVKKGLCEADCLKVLLSALERFGLPSETDYTEDMLFSAILSDKKRAFSKITLIVPCGIGQCRRFETTLDTAREFLKLGL